jgi:hypothetical protein
MQKDAGSKYVRDNFDPDDRLAVVLIDRRSGGVTQRIAPARQIASPAFQAWLKERNRTGADVFVSMNALHGQARGRTRADIAVVRHLYLDFDNDGTKAVERLQNREDMPQPRPCQRATTAGPATTSTPRSSTLSCSSIPRCSLWRRLLAHITKPARGSDRSW